MKISEQPVEDDLLENIRGCAQDAAAMLELQIEAKTPAEVVAAVDECVRQLQRGQGPEIDDDDDPALMLGSLWGEQLVRQFGWQWAGVTFHDHDDSTAVGVFSPDRSLAIYPLSTVALKTTPPSRSLCRSTCSSTAVAFPNCRPAATRMSWTTCTTLCRRVNRRPLVRIKPLRSDTPRSSSR